MKNCWIKKTKKKSNLLAFLHLLVLTQFIFNYDCTIHLQLPTIVTNQDQIGDLLFWISFIRNHRCTQVGRDERRPPRQSFEKLVNKNAIKKPKMVYPLEIFLKKPWFPPQGFWHKFEPPRPLDFQPCAPNTATYVRNKWSFNRSENLLVCQNVKVKPSIKKSCCYCIGYNATFLYFVSRNKQKKPSFFLFSFKGLHRKVRNLNMLINMKHLVRRIGFLNLTFIFAMKYITSRIRICQDSFRKRKKD